MWSLFLLFYLSGHDSIHAYEVGDCGIRYKNTSKSNGSLSNFSEFPWHVAIYRMDNNTNYKYICGGSIIDTDIVITAAHCVFNETTNDVTNIRLFIACGKYNSSWEHTEVFEQRFEVISKKVPSTYRGEMSRYQDDIALLALNDSIKFSSVVMPICVDWGNLFEPDQNETGIIVGWGRTFMRTLSHNLQVADVEMHPLTFKDCWNNLIGKDLFTLMTSDKFCGIEKNGEFVQKGFSGGALVFGRKFGINKTESRYFIKGIISNRHYRSTNIFFMTNINYHFLWIKNTKLNLDALSNSRKDGIVAADFQDCGTRYALNRFEPVISFGSKPLRSEFPWHVALYRQYSINENPSYICGGSIIHPKVIVTAAHCIYNETYSGIDNATFIVVAGKYYVKWEHSDLVEQRLKVVDIKLPYNYEGSLNRYAEDIALLLLNATIKYNNAIKPVCIDWNSEYLLEQLPNPGTVVGWGLTEKNVTSDELLMVNLNYIDVKKCRGNVDKGFLSYITSDKFCAGLDNGTAVQRGDSGGGIIFLRSFAGNKEKYYLYGITSIKGTARSNIAAFTDIRNHLYWLKNTLLPITGPNLLEADVRLKY